MPSFDVVSNVELSEVTNALNGVKRDIDARYDFKGSNSSVSLEDDIITISTEDSYKLEQIVNFLKSNFVKRKIDPKAIDDSSPIEKASGNTIRQKINLIKGIDKEIAKKIVKSVKDTKLKVQASIRGDELRIEGKKIDDLQNIMSIIKDLDLDIPIQFTNQRS